VRFQVLTALIIMSTIFWDETTRSLVDTYQCSGINLLLSFYTAKTGANMFFQNSGTCLPTYTASHSRILLSH